MFISRKLSVVLASLLITSSALAQSSLSTKPKPWSEIGRAATPNEIKAWDIDVRPDFKGLPAGSGSVKKGEQVWEAQCESCHGTFGENSEVFSPLVGGTTKADMQKGIVANLLRNDYPQRTSLMKLSTVSTLWDYINRAMPWNAPKSLTVEEVYAVTAYVLHLGDILPADFVLSDKNIAQVQATLPNRNGKTLAHGMWKVNAKPDAQGSKCMTNCATYSLKSELPDYAKSAHGNLADQSRIVGPTRGVQTLAASAAAGSASAPAVITSKPDDLAKSANCLACHGLENKVLGPSFKEVAAKYKNDARASDYLAGKIKNGAQGVWGAIPMPGNPNLQAPEIKRLVDWILGM